MKVGIYTPVHREQDATYVGGPRGSDQYRWEACAGRGVHVVGVYCDNDCSASTYASASRPAFDRLLADLRAQQFDRVLVLAQDRSVRRPEQLAEIMSLLRVAR